MKKFLIYFAMSVTLINAVPVVALAEHPEGGADFVEDLMEESTVDLAEDLAEEDVLDDEDSEIIDTVEKDEKFEDTSEIEKEEYEGVPDIYIKAVNPGYTIDGKSNVGEMIEIGRKNSDTPISLAGVTVGYTNSSGNNSILFEFPENSWMTGETILLRLASSPGSELASINYTKTLAFKAGISLEINDEIVDEVCWNGTKDCYAEFKSDKHTTLVRNLETGEFEHQLEYEPKYDKDSYLIKEDDGDSEGETEIEIASQCKGLEFSEILSYYDVLKTEQFIEFHNRNSWQIELDGCLVRYKNKNHILSGVIGPDEYFAYYLSDFSLTKNPVNSNTIELVDANGEILDTLNYPNGQRKGASYAMINYDENGQEVWRVTYAPTPGTENNYQEFKTCEIGKVINLETGNCVKATTTAAEKTCGVGYYLNPLTGRCKKQETKVVKTCKAGYYLNPLTGRCKKQETETTKTCKEGYYLNPETNRCRKIKDNDGATYNLEPENYDEKSSFVALYAVFGVLGAGGIYLIYEFRHEILKLFGKVFRRSR